MGARNYLVDGLSGTGKTVVCDELQRRGYQAIHGDRELKVEPKMDEATSGPIPGYDLPPLWNVEKVNALLANHDEAITFFCGGCSNSSEFIDRLDGVFVLEVNDIETVMRRIDERVVADPTDWGGKEEEREIIRRAYQTKETVPKNGIAIDAAAPIPEVVDSILHYCEPSVLDWLTKPVIRWTSQREDVAGLLLVGSHARGKARPDSDIDILLLVDEPETYVSNQEWVQRFGSVTQVTAEDWGAVTSLRVQYVEGGEVEFGLARHDWVERPFDRGTARVLRDGFRVLYDPRGLLKDLRNELERSERH